MPELTARQRLGMVGEQLAAERLAGEGYRVLARNYRCRAGEVDLVVEGADEVVFVEVRTRRVGALVSPEESVTRAKQRRLLAAAAHYLQAHRESEPAWRVDLVAVEVDQAGQVRRIEHLRDVVA